MCLKGLFINAEYEFCKIKYRFAEKNVELSDSEEEETLGDICVQCLFIPEFKRWKPYSAKVAPVSTLQDIKLKERNYYK
jgi:hypothetical protein